MEKQNPTSSQVDRNFSGLALPSLSILAATLSPSLLSDTDRFSLVISTSDDACEDCMIVEDVEDVEAIVAWKV
jgi:hypothetical protein